jgi:VWFA-related protein
MVARVKSPPPNVTLNKKLSEELIKLQAKDQRLLRQALEKVDKEKKSKEELDKFRAGAETRICAILKEFGWPSSQLVTPAGVSAMFGLLSGLPSFPLQRDLLPVIIAAVDKREIDRPHFAAFFDRLRIRVGMKQVFGTQATVVNGFLVLNPIENEAQVNARRREFEMGPLRQYLRMLERNYRLPLIKSPSAPPKVTPRAADSLDTSALGSLVNPGGGDDVDVVHIETNLVNLNVSVYSNKLKTNVSNLEQKDFSVFENGHEEAVSFFAATTVPFDLVLLIDLSGSTINKRALIRKSTLRFIEAARPIDRLSIVTFSTDTEVISPLTSDRTLLMASISRIDATEGGSNVWDAVAFALDHVLDSKSVERRRAVVLMSDGLDNALGYGLDDGSQMSFADLLEKIRRSDAMVIPIYLDTEVDRPFGLLTGMYQNSRKTMSLMADESGGLYYQARKIEDLEGVYEQVINDLGKVYSLGYKPNNEKHDGEWRSLKVQLVGHPDLVPRTRPGYYAN